MSGQSDRHPRRRVVLAAGIVALKQTSSGLKVLVVHRPKLKDWVLPKGHVEPGELAPETAYREFLEETGYQASVVRPIATVDYPVEQTIKRVHWFLGRLRPAPQSDVLNPAEISKVVWWRLDKALESLTYPDEREVLRQAAGLPQTQTLLVVRHGKALKRLNWKKEDNLRPLSAVGKRQADLLPGLLWAYGVSDLASSTSVRCVQTLQPYAKGTGQSVAKLEALSEEGALADPAGVAEAMAHLRHKAMKTGKTVAVCGHRPVLPAMLAALGVDGRYAAMKPGETLVVHLDATTGQPETVERYRINQ